MKKNAILIIALILLVIGVSAILILFLPPLIESIVGSGNFDKFGYNWNWEKDIDNGQGGKSSYRGTASASISTDGNLVLSTYGSAQGREAEITGNAALKTWTLDIDIKEDNIVLFIGDMKVTSQGRRHGGGGSATIGITDGTLFRGFTISVDSPSSVDVQSSSQSTSNIMIDYDEFTGDVLIGTASKLIGTSGIWLQKGDTEDENVIITLDNTFGLSGGKRINTDDFDPDANWGIYLASSATGKASQSRRGSSNINIISIVTPFNEDEPDIDEPDEKNILIWILGGIGILIISILLLILVITRKNKKR